MSNFYVKPDVVEPDVKPDVKPVGQLARFPVGAVRFTGSQSRWVSLGAGAGAAEGALPDVQGAPAPLFMFAAHAATTGELTNALLLPGFYLPRARGT
ncbi:hypothetical protein [Paraburkholderia bannensis]|uniref:hypothetical protein n=1 Tax=Paraburkholderia bannensis TaxID=765414 RepID=UPI0012EC105F|nr:hypothetical protein [Paraburkholderia bannensis]